MKAVIGVNVNGVVLTGLLKTAQNLDAHRLDAMGRVAVQYHLVNESIIQANGLACRITSLPVGIGHHCSSIIKITNRL